MKRFFFFFLVKWSVFLEALEKKHEPKRRADFNFTCLENNYDSFSEWKVSGPKNLKKLKWRFSCFFFFLPKDIIAQYFYFAFLLLWFKMVVIILDWWYLSKKQPNYPLLDSEGRETKTEHFVNCCKSSVRWDNKIYFTR